MAEPKVAIELVPSRCAICGTIDEADEVYAARSLATALNARTFSARRAPDGAHFRVVRCRRCGLLRSDPVAPAGTLTRLYAASTFDEGEVPNLRRTYGRYLGMLDRYGARKGALLEIGCGTGFFLEESLRHGYERAAGVEPSLAATDRTPSDPRIEIVRDVMREGLFPPGTFDVVCVFQTLDHLPDPASVLAQCLAALRPHGLLLALNHDAGAWSARVLGERSPIVDVEHTYLYDRRTMRRIAADRGFEVLDLRAAVNAVSLRHVIHLLPFPWIRAALGALLQRTGLGGMVMWLPLGNLVLIARKPATTA